MVLTRSDSSSSAWFVPSTALGDSLDGDQRRVRHLHSISLRNLTLDSTLDSFLAPTPAPPPVPIPTLLSHAQQINEEQSASFPFPVPRARSTSRASACSNGTTTSNLTVRQAPRLPPDPPPAPSSSSFSSSPALRPPSSVLFAAKESTRRSEALRRRLVDSFISIELVPRDNDREEPVVRDASPSSVFEPGQIGRHRSATTTTMTGGPVGGTTSKLTLSRSGSSTSLSPTPSPAAAWSWSSRRPLPRRRTVSSSFVPTTVITNPGGGGLRAEPGARLSTSTPTPSPFFVSTPAIEQVNPRFLIDQTTFIVPARNARTGRDDDESRPARRLPDDAEIGSWVGLRETRVRVRVFARPRFEERVRARDARERERRRATTTWQRLDEEEEQQPGKGKRKAERPTDNVDSSSAAAGDDKDEETGWRVVTEWDVDLSSLVSLGRDPTLFPCLPPNTVLFTIATPSSPFSFSPASRSPSTAAAAADRSASSSSTTASSSLPSELEYFTAPLDILLAHHERTRRRRRQRSISPGGGSTSSSRRWTRTLSSSTVVRPSYSDDEDHLTPGFGSGRGSDRSSDDEWDGDVHHDDDDDDDKDDDDDDDDVIRGGNASDPGVSSGMARRHPSRAGRRRRRGGGGGGGGGRGGRKRNDSILRERIRVEEDKRRRIELLERSRRETRMVELATAEVVKRLWVGEREIERVRLEKRNIADRLDEMVRTGGVTELSRDCEEREDRVSDLAGVKDAVEDDVGHLERKLQKTRDALALRRNRLERARRLDQQNLDDLRQLERQLDGTERTVAETQAAIASRRTNIVTLLSHLFPIEPVLACASDPSPPPLLFSILSLALPNSTYPPSYSDDLVSSALGHAAQLTLALAAYLQVPLCYPLIWRASRSVVKDEISMMKGPRVFPLYGKGVDQYRFDYGVFLLNKNIEQLMYSQGLTVLDLRNTLPNLKTLVLSLSHGEWTEDYTNASLEPEGVFATRSEGEGGDDGDEAEPRSVDSRRREVVVARADGDVANGESGTEREDEENSSASTTTTSSRGDYGGSTPETSIESLPPRPAAVELDDSAVASSTTTTTTTGRSRSSSMASAASTIRQHPTRSGSPSTPPPPSSTQGGAKPRRASGGGPRRGTEKHGRAGPDPSSSASATLDDMNAAADSTAADSSKNVEVKVVVDQKRMRKESGSRGGGGGGGGGGSWFTNSVWSAVAGKGGAREHSRRADAVLQTSADRVNGEEATE